MEDVAGLMEEKDLSVSVMKDTQGIDVLRN